MGARAGLACLLVAAAACGGRLDGGLLDAGDPIDAATDAPPVPSTVSIVRVHPWPGNGVQVLVELPAALAAETPGSLPEAWLEVAGGGRVDAMVARAGVTDGMTAIVVLPSADQPTHARRVAAADALVRALPAGERVALYVAREHAELLAELTTSRAHALARLAKLEAEPGASALFPTREVQEQLADVQSTHGLLGRAVVVIGDSAPPEPVEVPHVVQLFTMTVDDAPAAAASAVIQQLAARRAEIVRVGACGNVAADTPFTLHLGTATAADLFAPAPMSHLTGEPCVAADAAADRYPFPDAIDFTFTPAERQIFDQVYGSANENIEFRTSVTLGVGTPIAATAHLRGQGTLNCARKSFNVVLDGERRRLMPDVASGKFFLVSMCQDEVYVGQAFTDRLLQAQDLFAPRMHYVKLRIDGVNRGVYLLMEQPDNALRDDGVAVQSVIRRRYDIDNQPGEVKYPEDPALIAEEQPRFEAIGDRARFGPVENLDEELGRMVDLDQYYRILATYSLVHNGDYIDEFYFHGSTEGGAEYFRAMGWDTDDTFSLCHGGGGRAITDRCGLTYCAEAELDYALIRSPATYNRFLLGLDDVLARFPPETTAAIMAEVKDELWRALDDDETARGLVEIGGTTMVAARATIASRIDQLVAQLAANHATLVQRRAGCALAP
jgi:hypothetical protein